MAMPCCFSFFLNYQKIQFKLNFQYELYAEGYFIKVLQKYLYCEHFKKIVGWGDDNFFLYCFIKKNP